MVPSAGWLAGLFSLIAAYLGGRMLQGEAEKLVTFACFSCAFAGEEAFTLFGLRFAAMAEPLEE